MVTYTTDERFSAVRRDKAPAHTKKQQTGQQQHLLPPQEQQQQQQQGPASLGEMHDANSLTPKSTAVEPSDAERQASTQTAPVIEDWMLQIHGLQEADAGEYECQVNTQHPMLSAYVTLSVLCEYLW